MNAIEISNLSKTYKRRNAEAVHAVQNLNLSVPSGQVFGFLGPNGAGKTTTIKMMCGLVIPTTGVVHLNGHDVSRQRSAAMCQIGAVLEGTRNIYWRLSAWQNLLYFGRLKGCAGRMVKEQAEILLQDLDLWERRNDPVRDFSRGMQQKVAIACALIADPPIVLLDEPTLGLDVQAGRTVKQWVKKLAQERGKTVILTTHQLDMAEELCHRIAIMRQGQLIADEPTTALLDLFRQDHYQIRVNGHLSPTMTDRLLGRSDQSRWPVPAHLSFTQENGHTVISGPIQDQTLLYGLLDTVRDMGLPLVAVQHTEPKLEDVFVQLMEQGAGEQRG